MKKIYLFFAAFIMYATSYGQAGSLDLNFVPPPQITTVTATAIDSQGRILVGGTDSSGVSLVLRLNATTGSIDSNFNVTQAQLSDTPIVDAIFVQADNNILIGGYSYNGISKLFRVNQMGNATGFSKTFPSQFLIHTIAQQSANNGSRILVGGNKADISNINPTLRCLYALNPITGDYDTSFTPAIPPPSGYQQIYTITIDEDDNIYAGGFFNSYNNSNRKGLVKLSPNGTFDPTFTYNNIIGYVFTTAITEDGNSLIVGGGFTESQNGRRCLIKINNINGTGTLDTNFGVGMFTNTNDVVSDVVIQCGSNIIVGGNFHNVFTTSVRNNIARITSAGLLDPTFDPGSGIADTYGEYNDVEIVTNTQGDIYIGGEIFSQYNGIARSGVAKINGLSTLVAGNNTGTTTTAGGVAVANVLSNDNVNGVLATTSTVAITQLSSTNTGVTLNTSTGAVNVAANTPAGTYTLQYQICMLNAGTCTNCRTATVTVTVTSALPVVVAVADNLAVFKGCAATINVLTGDTYSATPATISNVTISAVTTPSGISFNTTTGVVTVPTTIALGTYLLTYRICSITNPTICSQNTVTITVTTPPVILAVNDNFTAPGYAGTQSTVLTSVLANDTNGGAPASTANVTITPLISYPELTLSPAGLLTISANVPPGGYSVVYKICSNTTCKCDTAVITVYVLGQPNAIDDTLNVPFGTGSTFNVYSNDTYANQPVNQSSNLYSVRGSLLTALPPGISYNTQSGEVTVSSTMASGSYTFTYQICDPDSNSTVCDPATVTINVSTPPITPGIRANSVVTLSKLQSNNKIIIYGYFTRYNNEVTLNIARLNSDLTVDTSFNSTGSSFNTVQPTDIKIQSDDKIIVVSFFEGFGNSSNGRGIARLSPNGNLDTQFNVGGVGISGENSMLRAVEIQSDGKIIIGGKFDHFNNVAINNITRLMPDGSIDSTFNSGTSVESVYDMCIQTDGKIIITSSHNNGLQRLKVDGTVDSSFSIGNGLVGNTLNTKVEVQSDGKIIIFGEFSSYNGYTAKNIARLNTNGSFDSSFITGTGFNGLVRTITFEPNGKIFVGGDFTTYNGQQVKKIVRLNTDGTLDTSFSTGTGPDGNVWTLTRQPLDGKLIVGGQFTSYNGISATNVTRIAPSIPGNQSRTSSVYWDSEPEIDIRSSLNKSISIYPNPSVGTFNIDLSGYDNQRFDVTIHNTLGQLVYTGTISSETSNQINLNNAQAGNYFIRLQNNTETIFKIVTVK